MKIKTFPQGGVHPNDNKLSAGQSIEALPAPQTVFIPVSQHIGAPAIPVVNVGDKVKTGQLLAKSAGFISANTHSSVSGILVKTDEVMDVSGYKKKAFVIKVQGNEWEDGIDLKPDLKGEITATPQEIKQKVLKAGIVGLGGAMFPSHVKLSVPPGKSVEYLTVNGAECEPYLTSDHRLMLEKAQEIIVGIRIILKALDIKKALVGIENNKPDAIKLLTRLSADIPKIEICPLKLQYPQGGERQLVKALTNREIPPPPKGLPIDVGCVVFNVGTIFAIYEALQKNKPLIERVVSVTGKSLKSPSNFLVKIGTPIADLIEKAGGLPDNAGKIISGGPMMGKALSTMAVPVTKGTSGIVILDETESKREEVINCIRCAKCVSVCPLGLEPYLLMTLSEKNLLDRAENERILNCCECGCCVYACPSSRPLLDHIRLGKIELTKILKSRK